MAAIAPRAISERLRAYAAQSGHSPHRAFPYLLGKICLLQSFVPSAKVALMQDGKANNTKSEPLRGQASKCASVSGLTDNLRNMLLAQPLNTLRPFAFRILPRNIPLP